MLKLWVRQTDFFATERVVFNITIRTKSSNVMEYPFCRVQWRLCPNASHHTRGVRPYGVKQLLIFSVKPFKSVPVVTMSDV